MAQLYLYGKDNEIFRVVNSVFVKVAEGIPTAETFATYGDTELNTTLLQQEDNMQVYFFSDLITIAGVRFLASAVYKGKIIIQTTDFILPSISAIKVTMATALPNNAILRFLLSVDSGQTWKKLSTTGEWLSVPIENIATEGVSLVELMAYSKLDLQALLSNSNTLRFAYYLEQTTSIDIISIHRIRINFDLAQ